MHAVLHKKRPPLSYIQSLNKERYVLASPRINKPCDHLLKEALLFQLGRKFTKSQLNSLANTLQSLSQHPVLTPAATLHGSAFSTGSSVTQAALPLGQTTSHPQMVDDSACNSPSHPRGVGHHAIPNSSVLLGRALKWTWMMKIPGLSKS